MYYLFYVILTFFGVGTVCTLFITSFPHALTLQPRISRSDVLERIVHYKRSANRVLLHEAYIGLFLFIVDYDFLRLLFNYLNEIP